MPRLTLLFAPCLLTPVLAAAPAKAPVPPALNHTVKDIDGKPVPLSRYAGKVLLVVNTASQCGQTPQYAGLQQLYDDYKTKGLVVLAFPSNDFGAQEPGTNAEIKQFCATRFKTTFPLFAKIAVKGPKQEPLYRFLTDKKSNPKFGGEVGWNFEKFLLNRKGEVVGRWDSNMEPLEADVVNAIEAAL
jgi:glutathione peroxidase